MRSVCSLNRVSQVYRKSGKAFTVQVRICVGPRYAAARQPPAA